MANRRPGAMCDERPFEAARLISFSDCTDPSPSHRGRLDTFRTTDQNRTSRFRGVYKADRGRWRSAIHDTRLGHPGRADLGTYATEETAALAYDIALTLLGYEPLNFPREHYRSFPQEALARSFRAIAARLPRPKRHPLTPHETTP